MEIYVNNVTKRIKNTVILDNVNLTLRSNFVYGLQGPNGSGKTMLMRLIAGLIRPTSGAVYIDKAKIGKDIDFPDSLGLLIENPGFLPSYTGLRNLTLLADLKGIIDEAQIRKTMKAVGLNPDDKRVYRKYSLGMKQRLGIAAAIMEQPNLVILDEPTNALDDQGIALICDIIKCERDRGALVIVSCHDAHILEQISDVIYTVNNGKVERKACP